MPELPEVEFHRRLLSKHLVGFSLLDVSLLDSKLGNGKIREHFDSLSNRDPLLFHKVSRKGKHLFLHLGDSSICWIHLGMSGRLILREPEKEPLRHIRLTFTFCKDKRVRKSSSNLLCLDFQDTRKFGKCEFMKNITLEDWIKGHNLGPDALIEIHQKNTLYDILNTKKQSIKKALLDQKNICGIGNIQASEILFDAKISPFRLSNRITKQEYSQITKSMEKSLKRTLRELEKDAKKNQKRDDFEKIFYMSSQKRTNPFWVYRKEGEGCPSCKNAIQKTTQNGRSTYYCSTCQK
jgi:formamidopyrimidine-DNA glycosylase